MTWEVHEAHERLYPDQGWTPAKAILEDEKHLHDADHPDANGWPIWHFRHTRPTEGPGSGVLPDCPIVDVHTHAWVDSFAPRMRAYFGDDVNCFHVRSFRDAMEAIAEGAADYAVLPVENSSAGIVADNYDLLVNFENYIVGEQIVKCQHALLGLPGAKLSDIKTVYSHSQALAQCEEYLDRHPEWRKVPYDNTALAAKKIAEEGDKTQAAVASKFAAQVFGLDVLEEHIYYNEKNSTRFIVVTNQRIFRKDATKISICFETPHSSGSLYNVLSHIIYNGLNMNKVESRPIYGRNWEYRFFVDFEGNLNDSAVKNALRGIREEAINMKILGNY